MSAPTSKPGRHRALGSAPRSAKALTKPPQPSHTTLQAIVEARYVARRAAAAKLNLIGFACVMIALMLPRHSDGELLLFGLSMLCLGVAAVLHPRARKGLPAAPTLTPTAEDLIVAEAEAAARLEKQQAELNDGQRHLADLEALNASTEQQLTLDDPQPYAQLGQSPFRDSFAPLEQRMVRPNTPVAPRPKRPNSSSAAAQPVAPEPAAGAAAAETLPTTPKLLK